MSSIYIICTAGNSIFNRLLAMLLHSSDSAKANKQTNKHKKVYIKNYFYMLHIFVEAVVQEVECVIYWLNGWCFNYRLGRDPKPQIAPNAWHWRLLWQKLYFVIAVPGLLPSIFLIWFKLSWMYKPISTRIHYFNFKVVIIYSLFSC